MCGIAGIISAKGRPEEHVLRKMCLAIAHRGPDGDGIELDGNVGLAHRRLSIIDLSSLGSQPMRSPLGDCCVVYNGEIYNYRELRNELKGRWEFRSDSDTEVLLAAYQTWGKNCLRRINGIYAFAIHDRRRQVVLLARDPFGVKPLFVQRTSDAVLFCSEIKGIIAFDAAQSRAVDHHSLHEFLYYGAPLGKHSMYKGIEALLPGECIEIGLSLAEEHRIDDIVDRVRSNAIPTSNINDLRTQIQRSVRAQMVADVKVGVLLSGGLDSSTIAAYASNLGEERVCTYSIGFSNDPAKTELPKARIVAKRFNTDHHELLIAPEEGQRVIEHLTHVYDGPFSDAANIPLYLLFSTLRGNVKVILQGDGGDELFAGYRRYAALRFTSAAGEVGKLISDYARIVAKRTGLVGRRFDRFMAALWHSDSALRMAYLLTVETSDASPLRLISPRLRKVLKAFDPFARYRDVDAQLQDVDAVQRMLWTDCKILLPDVFLTKVDRASMACGIEARVPLLDEPLARMVLGLRGEDKVGFLTSKRLLRQAMRDILPTEILIQRKTGFGVPYGEWLRGPLRHFLRDVLTDQATDELDLFDRPAMQLCVQQHLQGTANNAFILWKMMNLALWARRGKIQF